MIIIKNTQKKIKVSSSLIKKNSSTMLKSINLENYDLGIWLTTNATIRKYNQQFRGKDKATDIISFPYKTIKPGTTPKPKTPEDYNLGDIIISLEYVKKEYPKAFKTRMNTLIAHGIAHLLGHTHDIEKQYQQMHKLETQLLQSL